MSASSKATSDTAPLSHSAKNNASTQSTSQVGAPTVITANSSTDPLSVIIKCNLRHLSTSNTQQHTTDIAPCSSTSSHTPSPPASAPDVLPTSSAPPSVLVSSHRASPSSSSPEKPAKKRVYSCFWTTPRSTGGKPPTKALPPAQTPAQTGQDKSRHPQDSHATIVDGSHSDTDASQAQSRAQSSPVGERTAEGASQSSPVGEPAAERAASAPPSGLEGSTGDSF